MKRLFCLILSLVMLLTLSACRQDKEKILEPVNFYYCRSEPVFGTEDGLIAPYVVESAGYDEVIPLLQLYLQGCEDDAFAHTFPTGTELRDAYVMGQTVHLALSSDFARLSGVDLSIACACLTMTTLELVDATYVCITANGASMDGSLAITLSLDDLLLQDIYTPETTP